ncbi:MAG: hypothetical protein ACFFCO_10210 [Promethearchaeota archaeon]
MIEKTKLLRPRLSLQTPQILPPEDSVMELIAPTSQMILCRRTGNLVSNSYCIYLCKINKEQNSPLNPKEGDGCCIFAYNDTFGQMSDGALSES